MKECYTNNLNPRNGEFKLAEWWIDLSNPWRRVETWTPVAADTWRLLVISSCFKNYLIPKPYSVSLNPTQAFKPAKKTPDMSTGPGFALIREWNATWGRWYACETSFKFYDTRFKLVVRYRPVWNEFPERITRVSAFQTGNELGTGGFMTFPAT